MQKIFYEKNQLTYYCETAEELEALEGKVPAGSIIEYNSPTEFKVFMADSNGMLNEL